ncbi:MAG: glycosyltransferase family 4 protein [Rikenellaceae bacterium]|nr:glycosyltransferase family 4 protein [Rikenellaceae bacterium]
MKIGFDAKRVFFNNSGLGNYSRGAVNLLSTYYPDNEYFLFTPRQEVKVNFIPHSNTSVILPDNTFYKRLPSLWRSYRQAGDIKKNGINIFHGLSNELPADIRKSGARSVLTMHDIIFIHFPELYKPLDRYLYTKKYRRSCDNADRIIAISEQTRRDLVNVWNIAPEKIDVVYQGCDPMFYETADETFKNKIRVKYSLPECYLLSVGTIEERKNLWTAVKAVAEHNIDIDIVACGRHTPYADKIAEYAVKNNIENRLHFIHNVTFSDLPAIYQMAQGLIYASFYEGFGIPILEGLNSRIPVITSQGGVFPETGGDACIYIDPHSVEQMADAIEKILSDRELVANMTDKGSNYALKFRDKEVAEDIYSVYRKIF